jgi:hypothetical protein
MSAVLMIAYLTNVKEKEAGRTHGRRRGGRRGVV